VVRIIGGYSRYQLWLLGRFFTFQTLSVDALIISTDVQCIGSMCVVVWHQMAVVTTRWQAVDVIMQTCRARYVAGCNKRSQHPGTYTMWGGNETPTCSSCSALVPTQTIVNEMHLEK
jgi:hypothetical protein